MMRLPKVSRGYFTLNLKLDLFIFQSFTVNLSQDDDLLVYGVIFLLQKFDFSLMGMKAILWIWHRIWHCAGLLCPRRTQHCFEQKVALAINDPRSGSYHAFSIIITFDISGAKLSTDLKLYSFSMLLWTKYYTGNYHIHILHFRGKIIVLFYMCTLW